MTARHRERHADEAEDEQSGAAERDGFRATSLETLRQMVAAGVGVTLLPELAVRPPVPTSPDVHLLRFREPVPSRRIATFGRWTFDVSALRLADQSGREIPVTGGEMALLRVFIEHPNRVLLRSQILSLTKRSDAEVFDRAIDVLVGRLRRKIEEDPKRPRLILTIRGEGYRFAADVKWSASSE